MSEELSYEEIVELIEWKTNLSLRVDALRRRGYRNVTFSVFRRGDISDTHTEEQVNDADEVQFDGVIFDDDTTVIHWNTAVQSTAIFKNFWQLLAIHGHPEPKYATEFYFEGE